MKVEEWEKDYFLKTSELRRISKYTGLNFKEVENLPLSDYLLYSHDSWIDSWNYSKEGREFLKTLWRLKQTEADEKAIKEFRREEG
jgi:hypothetical protein